MDANAVADAFAPDGVSNDPVGTPPHDGRTAIRQFIEGILTEAESVTTTPDQVFIAGDSPNPRRNGYVVVLNGSDAPAPLELKAGVPQRFRLMGITVTHPGVRFALVRDGSPTEWTALAKDGRELPAWQQTPRRAELGVNEPRATPNGWLTTSAYAGPPPAPSRWR